MKIRKVIGYRIEVIPRGLGDFGFVSMSPSLVYGHGEDAQARMLRDNNAQCEQIAEDIKRHVDNVRSVVVEEEAESVCSHCGYVWTEISDQYNGGCCNEDEKAGGAQ